MFKAFFVANYFREAFSPGSSFSIEIFLGFFSFCRGIFCGKFFRIPLLFWNFFRSLHGFVWDLFSREFVFPCYISLFFPRSFFLVENPCLFSGPFFQGDSSESFFLFTFFKQTVIKCSVWQIAETYYRTQVLGEGFIVPTDR